MNKLNKILWGVAFLAAGALLILKALEVPLDLSFEGWWTLFLIVPGAIGLVSSRDKTASLITLTVGVLLFLCTRGIILWKNIFEFGAAAVVIIIGLRLIFGTFFDRGAEEKLKRLKTNGYRTELLTAIFGGCEKKVSGEMFIGGEVIAVFGGAELDLRNAFIEGDTVIKVTAVFGGIDVKLPDNVKVESKVVPILGGFSDKRKATPSGGVPTVTVTGIAMFGGIDVL